MNDCRVPKGHVPPRLYYVRHARSQAYDDFSGGFRARDYGRFYPYSDTQAEFSKSVENHLDWSSREPSPYLSVMSDRNHADNFALVMQSRTGYVAEVYEINARRLNTSYIFNVPYLMEELRLSVRPDAMNASEYLVLHRIPGQAVVGCRTTKDIEDVSSLKNQDIIECNIEFGI
ncbi:hypothetical protein PRK78_007286 [Emydomyces testavorans]|uniref:DUF7587 domain-containing protein n=1 Tax=Emydomyces testavorans TaxID=2070801 RepID=A0AAF0DRS0_9EURO|nr:hypothetical protein PRK78_007286 [Emydomyces testavorans]